MAKYHVNFENYLYLQRVAASTREAYLKSVAGLAAYHRKPPEELDKEQIQEYLHYCIQVKQLSWSSCNVLFCGLKKYYHDFLGRDMAACTIPPRTRSKKVPMRLSRKEVKALIEAPINLKHRALLATVYSSGLRVSEAVRLKVEDIDSGRMMIRVEEGKGRKGRYTVLSQFCLEMLRDYWYQFRPEEWLFFGRDKPRPMSINTAQRIYYQAREKAGITNGRGIHTLRHCFASHLLDAGVEIYVIKRWMGHSALKTTYKYIHLSPDYLRRTTSPLDRLYGVAA